MSSPDPTVAELVRELDRRRPSVAEEVDLMTSALARFTVAEMWPYGPVLWDSWEWREMPSPSSQMWPTSAARRR